MNNKTKDFFINDVEATELTLQEHIITQRKTLYEDVSKRGQATKHFRLDNGNFMAVVYDHPVHKLDAATGKYVDISPEIRETENDFEANMNQFKVRFPKIDGKDNCITVSKNGREIAWKFVPGQTARRNKPVGVFSRKARQSPWDIGEYPSVKYEKMDTDTDLQYEVLENGIKESIILAKKPNRKTFTFQLMLKGLAAKLSEDMKTILLFRSDEDLESGLPEMQIPPAFMEDKNGAFNDEIHYALRETESGTYLDLVLDTDWIFESERVYPVVIDPRVEIFRHGTEKMRLVEVCSDGTVVTAADRTDYRRVGIDDRGEVHRLYIDFDLPELADGYKITQAGMLLYQKDYATYNGNVYDYIVAPVTDPNGKVLDSSSFNWINVQNLNIGSHIDILRGHARPAIREINIDMTQVVENWYDSNTPFLDKRCVVVKKVNEPSPCHSGACQAAYIDLFSLHNGYGNQPKLYIEYTGADVYSDHQKYHTFENGRAGTGSVNLFTGKMSFVHGDVIAEGVKLPLAVSHLYRFEYIEKNANGAAIPSKYGIGWKLSVEQTLEIVDKHGIVAVYTNAQGKRHYFTRDETNTSQKVTDDAGLGLTYSAECNEIDGHVTAHILKDEKGNKMTFDSSGKLIQLIDTNGNVSSLEYYNGNLTSVIDGNSHSASLYYNEQNKLDCIVDGNGRAIYYTYDTAGDLVSITYPSADTAYNNEGVLRTEFVYDNVHRLTKVIDYSGIAYTIDYNGDKVSMLTCSGSKCVADNQVVSSEELIDNAVFFEYRTKSTAVVDDWTGIKTVYKFDKNGREVSSYVDMTHAVDAEKIGVATPTEIAGYASIVDNPAANRVGKYRSLSVTMNNDPKDEINLIKNGLFMFTDSSSKPTDWTVTGSGTVSSECYISGRQSYSFRSGSQIKYLTQTVNLCECELEGNVLVVSAWAKAYGNNTASSDTSSARFRLVLQARYEDGVTDEYVENYDPSYHDWQYAAIPFVLNDSKRPVAVTVKLDFSSNYGTVYFTNVRLVSVDGIATTNTSRLDGRPVDEIYVFDECKAIKTRTVKKDSITTTTDYIDENSDIVRTVVADRGGNYFITSYKYDSKHNLIKTQDYRGLVIEYTYNAYGKELTRKTYHVDTPNAYMYSEHTYQEDNFVASESDPRYSLNGEKLKTTYVHDTSRNLLLQQTDVNGQAYNYAYDDTSDDLLSLSSTTDNKTNENQFFYTRGYLTRVAHNGFNFGFGFDELGRSKTVTVGDDTVSTALLTMNYEKANVANITETEYASGEKSSVITDILGNPINSTYIDKNKVVHTISNATYDSAGKVKQLVDNERGVCYNYTYDAKGNVIRIVEKDAASGAVLTTNDFVFDENERLTHKLYGAVNQIYRPLYEATTQGYIYPDNEVIGITLEGKYTDKVTNDGLRRAQRRTFTVGARTLFEETYGYLSTPHNGKTIETEIVSSVASHVYGVGANSETVNYTYDKAGNLETVSRGTVLLSKYYYDGLNRLKREDNHTAGRTYVWDYDVGGNILFKKEYALCTDVNLGTCLHTKTYTYKTEGWRDRLDSYNGLPCVYDAMGNPTTYLGNTLTWTKVRRLASFGSNTFAYGANGIRYRKNNTVYTLDGNKILRESDGNRTITYYHGGSGIVGFAYNGTDYYFRKNLQGDVMEIYTAAGAKAASYAYDAWGKVLAVNNYTAANIGDLNPIRYRGYYYDVETGLYYLNSRYYDPETGRFINADTTDVLENAKYDINGLNLYAYCNNNPVAGRDDEGNMSFWKKLAIAAAVVVAVAVVAAVVAVATGGTALCAVGTVLVGAAKGAAIGAVTGAMTGAATGAVQGAVEGYRETGTLEGTLRGMGKGAAKGAVRGAQDGLISGMVMGGISAGISSMSGNPMFCFVAGTTVLTTLGKKAIEAVRVGDTVPCVDHITGEVSEKKVVTTTVNKVNRLTELDIDGEIIQCTETHPFQVKGKGWVDACNLIPGDVVYTKDWNTATVRSVNLLELPKPVEVFNFEVEDCHTYFVGNLDLLVHNGPCSQRNAMRQAKRSENIPMSQKPDVVQIDKMIGENGRTVFAKTEIYGDKFIRNDLGGHLFKDGATLPKHFNAGVVERLGKNEYKFISNGMHFFYG